MKCNIPYINNAPISETEKLRLESIHLDVVKKAKDSKNFREIENRLQTIKSLYPKATEFVGKINTEYGKIAKLSAIGNGNSVLSIDVLPLSKEKQLEIEPVKPSEKNTFVDSIYNKILDVDKRMVLVPATATEKRHYTLDGEKIAKSVTEKVKENQNMQERTPEQQIEDDQKREWGSEGHAYIASYIESNLIDKDGYALSEPKGIPVESKLNRDVQQRLRAFARELVSSYAPGTRFIIEKKVVNEKYKGKLASTIDFVAIEPVGTTDVKVDVLDWKFMNVNTEYEEDVPWYKKKEWNAQMGDYATIMYNYGVKPTQLRKARMIPFQANYVTNKNKKLALKSIEIGKLDVAKETNMYLLPVPLESETSGDREIDNLLRSLRQFYKNLFKAVVGPEDKFVKNQKINELSKSIRALHIKKDFAPLALVGTRFLKDAAEAFKTFENIDYNKLSDEEIDEKLAQLLEFKNSAGKFASLDEVFLKFFPKEGMSEENKKILLSLERISSSTERMIDRLVDLEKEFVVYKALKENVTQEGKELAVLNPEKEIKGLVKTFLEGSKLPARLIKLASNLIQNAKNLVSLTTKKLVDRYTPLLLALEKEAAAKGKSAFNLIGTVENGKLALIRKIDKDFSKQVYEARKKKNRKFFLENMNLDEYRKLAKKAMDVRIADLKKQVFSADNELVDELKREAAIEKVKKALNIDSVGFNGYEDFDFKRLFWDTLKEENHLSKEYKEMSKEALAVWNFFTELNQKGRKLGYLNGRNTNSFFPLMEATIIEKLYKTSDVLSESGDIIKDLYTIRAEEEYQFSKIDEETGEVKKEIPKLFTRTSKSAQQLSTDLNKVGVLWIKALTEYESNKSLENTLLVLHSVEKAKGRILTDSNNNPIFEGGLLKVDESTNKNADILQTIIDDSIYGLKENLNSIGNIGLGAVTDKLKQGSTEEEKEETKLSVKKGLQNSNKLIQSLAVGLKLLVTIPNYVGMNMQAAINAGRLMTFKEFEKNNAKITTGIGLSTIEKALLNEIVPLNENITQELRRDLAKKEGFINYISTWSFHDVMMVSNSFPDRLLQFASALSFLENTMVVDGELVNIRQFVTKEDQKRYKEASFEERRALEKSFDERVQKIKDEKSIVKTAKITDFGVEIPGVSDKELAKYRVKIIEYSRNLSGQMSEDNKADYRRDTILKSFMMFKGWIPKQVSLRTLDIHKNLELDQWEYGRTRAFLKTMQHLGLKNIANIRDIVIGTDRGLEILKEMYESKKEAYYLKTGQELEISEEEFYDMMRSEIQNQIKELYLLVGVFSLFIAVKMAEPPDDEDVAYLNKYKFWAKASAKIMDELWFYYNPLSFESMTRGSVLPALGLATKAEKFLEAAAKESYARVIDDEDMIDKTHPLKYFFNLMPVASQYQNELLPIFDPELAKEMGIRVTDQPRQK